MGMIRMALGAAAMLLLAGCVGYGYPTGGGYDGYDRYPDSRRYHSGGYYGGDYGRDYGRSTTVRCESHDQRNNRCPADTRGGVMISRQLSRTQCVQGRNWGWDNAGIWVSQGCRAEFVTGRGGHQSGWPGAGGHGQVVRCESNDKRSRRCPADTRGGVMISRQLSRTQCVQGRNWGWDRSGIWVDGGCRAEFRVR